MTKIKRNSNFYSGIILLIFAILLLIATPSQVPLYDASDALSPRLVPYITLTFILILAIIMILSALLDRKIETNVQKEKSETDDGANDPAERSYKDLFIFLSICIFIIVFAESIGFTFASMIGLFIGLTVFGAKSWIRIVMVSISVPLIIEIGYRALGIYLPLGFWEDIVYSIF